MIRASARVGQAITALVLIASGTYLIVYLYRWEWNRALVAGIFFVATEVALLGSMILGRLGSIEHRIQRLEHDSSLDTLREAAPPPTPTFAWLDESTTRLQVFVPVLLGAGVILSLLASGVERLAGATTRPVMERRLARRLDVLGVPPDGLVGTGPVATRTSAPPRPPRRTARPAAIAFLVFAIAGLAVASVDLLADATEDRPDPPLSGQSEVTLTVERRFKPASSSAATAEALFVACRHTIGQRHGLVDLRADPGGPARLTIAPALGKHATRRFVGCLEDALFDRVSADVTSVRRVPHVSPP